MLLISSSSIIVHAIPNADQAWGPADMKAAAALRFIDKLFFPKLH